MNIIKDKDKKGYKSQNKNRQKYVDNKITRISEKG